MLRRGDPQSSDEQTEAQERPIRTVIVIGASAGGRAAIVLKDLSHDIPAAIVVMRHVAPDSDFDLSKWFRQFGHIEIRETTQGESQRNSGGPNGPIA